MKSSGWIPNSVPFPLLVKRDAVLLPALFLLNVFFFSAWLQLGRVMTEPWLLLVWLYGLAMLVPLVWRDSAPVTVFAIQCLATVVAWPVYPHYTPVVGIPVALYAVAVHCRARISLLALLTSFIPNGLAAAVAFRVHDTPAQQIISFIPNAALLLIIAGGAWGAGRVTQASHRHVQHLERERQAVREAVAAERRKIARELYDIISDASDKKAMVELRRLLRLLEASNPSQAPARVSAN